MRCETCGYTLPEGTETCPICGRPCSPPAPQGGHSPESAAFFDAILPASGETDSTPERPAIPAAALYTPKGTSYSYGAVSEEGFCRLEGDRFLTQEDGVLTLWEGSGHWILGESVTGFYALGQQDYLYAF